MSDGMISSFIYVRLCKEFIEEIRKIWNKTMHHKLVIPLLRFMGFRVGVMVGF